jgi:hypothetical protein
MADTRKTETLEAFLAGLPDDDAAAAQVAAAQIDALERQIGPPGWIERNLLVLGAVSSVLFVLGIAGFFLGLQGLVGLGTVVALISVLPAMVLAYLLSVRGQTRLDDAKMALNEKHFLPHGGIYFGVSASIADGDGDGGGKVLLVKRPTAEEPDLRSKIQAQYDAAAKRRLW